MWRKRPSFRGPSAEDMVLVARYAADPGILRPGHRIILLEDGRGTFPEMLGAIERAREFVHLQTYIFADDDTGRRFAAALRERARAGVTVRLIVDGFGSIALPDTFLTSLEHDGVQVVTYEPLLQGPRWQRWLRRDHRKLLVVDGRIGFTGGINIGDDYAPEETGGKGWRDTHARIHGPLVADLEDLFRDTWIESGGEPYRAFAFETAETSTEGDWPLAGIVATGWARRSIIRRHVMHSIQRANGSIWIANAYFIPDRALSRALIAAAGRGIDVRVIVPVHSDVKAVQWAGEATYGKLLAGGVRVYQFNDTHMHAKTMVVDGIWSVIGSYNLDYVSLFLNAELVVEVFSRSTGAEMRAMFMRDLARSTEVEREAWRQRPTMDKWLQQLSYRFRRWL